MERNTSARICITFRQVGHVFTMSVCWFVTRITRKLLNWFPRNLNEGWVSVQNRPHYIFVEIRMKMTDSGFFSYFLLTLRNWETNRFKYVSLDIKLDYIKEMCALLSVILVSKSFQMLWEAQTNQQTNSFCVARQKVRVCSTPDSWRRLEFEPHHRPISIFTSS